MKQKEPQPTFLVFAISLVSLFSSSPPSPSSSSYLLFISSIVFCFVLVLGLFLKYIIVVHASKLAMLKADSHPIHTMSRPSSHHLHLPLNNWEPNTGSVPSSSSSSSATSTPSSSSLSSSSSSSSVGPIPVPSSDQPSHSPYTSHPTLLHRSRTDIPVASAHLLESADRDFRRRSSNSSTVAQLYKNSKGSGTLAGLGVANSLGGGRPKSDSSPFPEKDGQTEGYRTGRGSPSARYHQYLRSSPSSSTTSSTLVPSSSTLSSPFSNSSRPIGTSSLESSTVTASTGFSPNGRSAGDQAHRTQHVNSDPSRTFDPFPPAQVQPTSSFHPRRRLSGSVTDQPSPPLSTSISSHHHSSPSATSTTSSTSSSSTIKPPTPLSHPTSPSNILQQTPPTVSSSSSLSTTSAGNLKLNSTPKASSTAHPPESFVPNSLGHSSRPSSSSSPLSPSLSPSPSSSRFNLATYPPQELVKLLASLLQQIASANDTLRASDSGSNETSDGAASGAVAENDTMTRDRSESKDSDSDRDKDSPNQRTNHEMDWKDATSSFMSNASMASSAASSSSRSRPTSATIMPTLSSSSSSSTSSSHSTHQAGIDSKRHLTASLHSLHTPSSYLSFHARNVPGISIEVYLLRILKYCPASNEVFLSLLVYFDRMSRFSLEMAEENDHLNANGSISQGKNVPIGVDPTMASAMDKTGRGFAIDSFNVHRLVIAGVTVASKFFSDVFYTNSRYAKVGGLPLSELNQLELQFLLLNDFSLMIPLDEMQRYGDQLLVYSEGLKHAEKHEPCSGPA